MSAPLFAHQESGADWLAARWRAMLCDEQGLGKTATSLVAAERAGVRRLLVLAPTSVALNWAREIRRWAPDRKVQVVTRGSQRVDPAATAVVVTHGLLLAAAVRQQLLDGGFDGAIVDEAHAFKNRTAKRTRVLYDGVALRLPRVWLLTGTPMPNNPSELWTALVCVAPERFRRGARQASFWQFREAYCQLRPIPGAPRGAVQIVGGRNLDDLRRRLDGVLLRRTKVECLDLPPRRWATVTVAAAEAAVATQLRELEGEIPGLAGASPEEALRLLRDHPSFSTYRRLCGVAKAGAAVELLAEELESDPEHRVVVFCHHREVAEALVLGLAAHGVVRITGDTSAQQRQQAVETFQAGAARVAVCQIVAGGTGVTLTRAHHLVFVEQSWSPGENAQAADRVHRLGQTESVLVRTLALAGSVDERIAEVLALKSSMIREVITQGGTDSRRTNHAQRD